MLLSRRVEPGSALDLATIPTRGGLAKHEAVARLEAMRPELEYAHEGVWAGGKKAVLVLLQGMDTAGKDRVIRRVFSALVPQALEVHAFGPPTKDEARQDFLWRYHQRLPPHGKVGVFNRTWYESVLIERVDRLVTAATIEARFGHIRAFESLLADSGTTLLKVYLHVSRNEQSERLEERRKRPDKRWKHNPLDLAKHRQYDEYLAAYEDALRRTTTKEAPWHVVPADHKPTRDLAVAELVLAALKKANGAGRKGTR